MDFSRYLAFICQLKRGEKAYFDIYIYIYIYFFKKFVSAATIWQYSLPLPQPTSAFAKPLPHPLVANKINRPGVAGAVLQTPSLLIN